MIPEKLSRKIKAMFEDIGVKIRIADNTLKVGKYPSLKNSTSHMYQGCLVYKFTFPVDLNNQYIVETNK